MNTGLPTAKPWSGAQGIPSGESRAHLTVQAQQRKLTPEESAVATFLGQAGIPLEAAGKLAVMILGLRKTTEEQAAQITYLQDRVRELLAE